MSRQSLLNQTILYTHVVDTEYKGTLQRAYGGDAGYDLPVSRTMTIHPRTFAQVPSNIRVALPKGTWSMIVGRSSTFYRKNLLVNAGIIDNGWRGPLFAVVYNPTDEPVVVRVEERLAQLIVFGLVVPDPRYVKDLPEGDRNLAGFGSTGG